MEGFQIKSVIPGEQVAREKQGFMAGWGTYANDGIIYSSVAGTVQTISKLVTVVPQKSRYKPEIGDVVIGRVINVDKKSWRLDIKSQRDSTLMLTAINLPQGEQRRRSEQDQMMMRSFFQENDLVSGEIQAIHKDGSVSMQTRNLKYGKLKNGILLEVKQELIKKMKYHFIDLKDDVKLILGMNGLIWIYYSTIKLEQEYFSEDLSKIEIANKNEKINESAALYLVLFRNLILILDRYSIEIDKNTITKTYEIYSSYLDTFKSPTINYTDILRNNIMETEIVQKIRQHLGNDNKKSNIELSNVIKNLNNIINENDNEMDEDN